MMAAARRTAGCFSVSALSARWRSAADQFSNWLRYEIIYLWPGRQKVATFNVGLMPVDASVAAEAETPAVASTVQVYSELARALRASSDTGPNVKALEIGCGRGGGLAYLNRVLPFATQGLDRSIAAVRFARRRKLDALRGSATDLPFQPASLDIVLSAEFLFIFPEKEQVFAEIARVLKPGGKIVAADFRQGTIGEAEAHVRDLAGRHGFALHSFEDLTERARLSVIEGEPARRVFLDRVPRIFHRDLENMLYLAGSPRYLSWTSGRRSYFLTVLERLPSPQSTYLAADEAGMMEVA